mmetsp:Transcript_28885/g.81344  ORF Transcript_28885/g.81344 Transcript_28885/m.81344 type:complete len:225 (-) Transcript_28885:29-703(-)
MRLAVLPLALLAVPLLTVILAPGLSYGAKRSDVVVLTDSNFDDKLSKGEWMIEIYAPWCVHCKALQPTWEELATKLKGQGINVGKIDGVREKVLLSRFRVEGFPSIYHIAEGETREYVGARSLQALESFAQGGWRQEDPVGFWRSPTSFIGRLIGTALGLPGWLQSTYQHLKHELGYSEVTILVGALAIPLTVGVMSICLLDAFYSRATELGVPEAQVAHAHRE